MKFLIKIKRRHPKNQMNLLKHVITNVEKVFDLSEKDIEVLKTPEAKRWFDAKEFIELEEGDEPRPEVKNITDDLDEDNLEPPEGFTQGGIVPGVKQDIEDEPEPKPEVKKNKKGRKKK